MLDPSRAMSAPYTWIDTAVPGPSFPTRWMSPGGQRAQTVRTSFTWRPPSSR